jgi:hypothetical protein
VMQPQAAHSVFGDDVDHVFAIGRDGDVGGVAGFGDLADCMYVCTGTFQSDPAGLAEGKLGEAWVVDQVGRDFMVLHACQRHPYPPLRFV